MGRITAAAAVVALNKMPTHVEDGGGLIVGADICWDPWFYDRRRRWQSYDCDGSSEYTGDNLLCHGRPGWGLYCIYDEL